LIRVWDWIPSSPIFLVERICSFCIRPDDVSSSDRLSSFFVPIKEQRNEETSRYPVVSGILIIPERPQTVHLDGGFNRSGEPDIPGKDRPVISEVMLTVRLVQPDE
jgi:hypothetical protein